ncbi:MAG: hypothetical protein IPM95_10020 [Sphingobacteriales bacterium]|nr:hypothetical protein [Sphingobacteriales bacterium]
MKWFCSLVIITGFFILAGFYIADDLKMGYYWMSMGMAAVSFLFYLMIVQSRQKLAAAKAGANLAAITLKFIASMLVVILYVILFGTKHKADFLFFIISYCIFSVISYTGAYYFK